MNSALTDAYKKIVMRLQLIDTGNLLRSINVDVSINRQELIINVKGVDYLEYVDKKYQLSKLFSESFEFNNEISDLFAPILEKMVDDQIQKGTEITPDLSLKILVNGN